MYWKTPLRVSANGCFRFYRPACNGRPRPLVRHVVVIALCLTLTSGCTKPLSRNSASPRDINAVLADHDEELLGIAGVTGVYVGLLSDGKTPCLRVMLVRKDANLERRIPRTLEGYPVVTEVTGEIRPLNKFNAPP
jgi:hypothetical protein